MDIISIIPGLIAIALAVGIPGYALSLAIFPKRNELDTFERIAFSFILSIAVPGIVLLAGNMLLGIGINFISASLTYVIVTAAGIIGFIARSRSIKASERIEFRIWPARGR